MMDAGVREDITVRVRRLAETAAAARGLAVLEVEYRPGGQLLRVFLDRRHGQVGIDDCSAVSQQLSAALDELDLIPRAYRLEVSSPGLDRPLRGEEDFLRFRGEPARLTLERPAGGAAVSRGRIGEMRNGMLRIEPDGEEPVWVPVSQIRSARLDPAPAPQGRPGKNPRRK